MVNVCCLGKADLQRLLKAEEISNVIDAVFLLQVIDQAQSLAEPAQLNWKSFPPVVIMVWD